MDQLKVRWLLFWYLVPTVAYAAWMVAARYPSFLVSQPVLLAVTAVPSAGYLLWVTWSKGPGWFGRLTGDQWRGWVPMASLAFGAYLCLLIGAEPAWAAFWEPKLAALGFSAPTPPVTPPTSAIEGLALVLLVGLLVPIVEESLFRGGLLRLWTRWWGPGAAVAATALLFGMIHAQGQVFKVLMGAAAAVLALRSGSLAVPVTLHMLVNLTAVTALLAAGAGAAGPVPETETEVAPVVQGLFFLAGLGLSAEFVRRLVHLDHPLPRRRRKPWAGFSVAHRRPVRFRGLAGRRRFS